MLASVLRHICNVRFAGRGLRERFLRLKVNKSATPTLKTLANVSRPGDGRGVHTALDQADELHRATDLFRKFCLRQLPRLAQVGDSLAKFLLKHGLGIPHMREDGNGAKLRVAVNAITDGYATAAKMFTTPGQSTGLFVLTASRSLPPSFVAPSAPCSGIWCRFRAQSQTMGDAPAT